MGEHVGLANAPHFTIILFDDRWTWNVDLLLRFLVPPFGAREWKNPGIRGEDSDWLVVLPTHGKDPVAGDIIVLPPGSGLLLHFLPRHQWWISNAVGSGSPHIAALELVSQELNQLDAREVIVCIDGGISWVFDGLCKGNHNPVAQ